jgi:tRNA(Ile2) C34 agmatinyltransferase TiaS
MSFLARSAQPIRQIVRTPIATRAFTVSALRQKGPVDAAKDALKTVDRKVSDKLVGGIKVGGKLYHTPSKCIDRSIG